ncbi:hypothetical protein D9611_006513 [Ephemerocybe angulata]|uniref:Uncharacterized protein n=1 Tax=Ephemerocybe angulata TaxID=980116 RepID=A0A8H5C9C4_9AGAR|nr:hypothetical protein D9611_006513 [Tulosesus angulatus]
MADITAMPIELTDRIPEEIYACIISAAAGDKTALQNLSLVCHAWGTSSRLILFSSICAYPPFMNYLAQSVEGGNRILPCIRKIRFLRSSRTCLATFERVAPQMSNLCALRFLSCSAHYIASVGRILDRDGRIRTLELLHPRSFRSFRQFQDILALYPGIQTLVLEQIKWGRSVTYEGGTVSARVPQIEGPEDGGTVPPLENLRAVTVVGDGTASILCWLADGADRIRTLVAPRLGLDACRQIVRFPHIEKLVVGFRRVRFEDIEGTMSAFRALRYLVISNEIDLRDSRPPSTPNTSSNNQFRALELPRQTHWFSLLLSSISSPLSHLTFPVITLDSEKQLELVDWDAINDLLCGSCMREVVIKVNIGDNPISSEHIESDIRQRLSEGLRKGTQLIVEVWKYSLETAKE